MTRVSAAELIVEITAPVATAVIAAVAVVIGTWNGARNDHAKWLREQRREAYATYLSVLFETAATMETPWAAARAAGNAVRILGPSNIEAIGRELFQAGLNYRDAFRAADADARATAVEGYQRYERAFVAAAQDVLAS